MRSQPAGSVSPILLAALLTSAFCVPAQAQEIGADPPVLGEIVVTASLRSQALRDAPVSVAALTASALNKAHITRPQDLPRATPGLQFNANDDSFSIRGVSSNAGAATTGLYVDDVPLQIRAIGTLPQSALPSLFDLARVEVIRGPQGALFGAGSEGGVVRFVTAKPSFAGADLLTTSEVSGTTGGGENYALGLAETTVLAPDLAALRLGAFYRRDGGWVDRVDAVDHHVTDADANRSDQLALRATGLLQPSPSLQLTPLVLFERRRRHDADDAWAALSDPRAGVYRNANPVALPDDDHFALGALGVRQQVGDAELFGEAAYFRRRQHSFYDGSIYNLSWLQQGLDRPLLTPTGLSPEVQGYAAAAPIHNRQDDVTLEVRLQSRPEGELVWTAGIFLQRSLQSNQEAIVDPQFDALNSTLFGRTGQEIYGYGLLPGQLSYSGRVSAEDRQAAAFGDITWRVTSHLALSAGLRVARTKFRFNDDQDGPYNGPGPSHASGSASETPVTPKFSLAYSRDGRLVYITVAKGYRIGGANAALPLAFCAADLANLGLADVPSSYRSDTTWNYEAGFKGEALGGRMDLAASLFQIDWRGIQQNVYLPGCGFQFTANLGHARSRGLDLQAQLRLNDHMNLRLAAGWVDARYVTAIRAGAASGAEPLADKGDALPGAPWGVSVGWDLRFQAANRPGFANLDYEIAGDDLRGPVQDPTTQAYDPRLPPARSGDNLHLRVCLRLNTWEAALFADNLLNRHGWLEKSHEDRGTDLFTVTTPRPRTVGVAFTRGL